MEIQFGVAMHAVRTTIRVHGESVADGDVFLANDPHSGGGVHPQDVVIQRPVFAEGQLVGSDYLWLDAPPIALSGSITVHLVSEIPGTDLILLLNKKPRADEASLLSAHIIPPLMKAEVRTPITLTSTTDLMFIARANGRWYKVSSEVKVAVKSKK